ncbi:MAG: efflux RND transporter periplasmic adaptor subunit [Proteobacteria bacterium]|nr:efflux RND transporter periplasmic adaptor subunit [Pseudomonadota bacterium]
MDINKTDMENLPDQNAKKSSKKPWIFTGLVLLAIVGIIVFSKLRKPEEPVITPQKLTNVEVITIKTEKFVESLNLPAIVNADRVASIKPEFTGIFERWLFPEGGLVEMGDVIAEMDTKSLRLNLEELEAALKSASQNVILSNISKEKTEINLANMRENVKIQENALESSEANLKLARKQHKRVGTLDTQKVAKAQVNLANMKENLKIRENALESAESNLKFAQNQHDRIRILNEQNRAKAQVNLANMKENLKIRDNALESAESNLSLAKKQHDRIKKMVSQNLTSENELDDVQNSLTQAELSVAQARRNRTNAVLNIKAAELAVREVDTSSIAQKDSAQNSLTQAELSVVRAKQDLNNARLNIDTANLGVEEVDTGSAAQEDDAQNRLTQAELSVIASKQSLNNALLNIEVAKLAIKEAAAGVELAEAKIVELEASIEVLEYQIEKGRIKAPFSGILESHLIVPGEMASPGSPICTVYDLKHLRATIDVPDRYIAFLDPNNEKAKNFIKMNLPDAKQSINAKIIIPGLPKLSGGVEKGLEFSAKIARIAQSSNPESNTFEVELRFPNPGNAIKHGLIARSKIEYLYYPNAIMIPVKAIQVTDVGPRILVVESENNEETAVLKDIKPVSIQGSRALIRGGLQQGDRLIVAGWKGLVGGEKINILVDNGVFKKLN